ncbi:hypothetical protein M758_6G131700 [Ceratodon purpureus]|nr:hypothetical protein M758_6G131700 [Ceratodon purpureus]
MQRAMNDDGLERCGILGSEGRASGECGGWRGIRRRGAFPQVWRGEQWGSFQRCRCRRLSAAVDCTDAHKPTQQCSPFLFFCFPFQGTFPRFNSARLQPY